MSDLPTGNALVIFVLCMVVGAFVIVKFCLEQFGKSTTGSDENDPWKFLVIRFLTSPNQYLTGFTVYCGIILVIFAAVSLIGPGPIFEIAKALGPAATQVDPSKPARTFVQLHEYPTFPILVAFYVVGLNPNLPKWLDFEIVVRRLAHRVAYIPTSMHQIFNFMRFSDFDLSEDHVQRAWDAAGATDLRRAILDAPDFKTLVPVFDRTLLLYARASMLAGDATFDGAVNLPQTVNLEVFEQYREAIRNVGVNLQAINARFASLATTGQADRRRAVSDIQRDLVRNLESLYAIFAAAATTKRGNGLSDRLRAIGFTSPYPPPAEIPWDPLLKVMGAAAVVMAIASVIASVTLSGSQGTSIPRTGPDIAKTLAIALVVHLVTIWQTLAKRTRLIACDKYFSETGNGRATAYIQIFLRCAIVAWLLFIVLYLPNFLPYLTTNGPLSTSDLISLYLRISLWFVIPASCGVMTAFALDRSTGTFSDRLTTGIMQAGVMAMATIGYVMLASDEPLNYYVFMVVLYGGLGFVLGFLLPSAIRRYWRAQEVRLPERIGVLRNAVLLYFRDIQQFMDWLHARNDRLSGKRPLDVLTEERGLQELTALVTATRSRLAPAT